MVCAAATGTTSSVKSFIDLTFHYANEAFNGIACGGPTRSVLLAIYDYNTEQEAKRPAYARLSID